MRFVLAFSVTGPWVKRGKIGSREKRKSHGAGGKGVAIDL